MRSARALAACLPVLAGNALAAPEEFEVDPRHTFPAFEVEHLGISTQRGRFDRTRGRIVIDRDAGTGTVDVAIEAASVSTGYGPLDAVIRGEEFLDAGKHPTITFRAAALAFDGGVPRSAAGELTIAGATQPVELRVTRFGCTRLPFLVQTTCGADLEANIRRSQFGMTAYAGFVGEDVRLRIQVEAVRLERADAPVPEGGGGQVSGTISGGWRWK